MNGTRMEIHLHPGTSKHAHFVWTFRDGEWRCEATSAGFDARYAPVPSFTAMSSNMVLRYMQDLMNTHVSEGM